VPRLRAASRTTDWLWRIALLLVAAGAAAGFFRAGRFLASEDPIERADAIFVLAGTRVERPLEAADLYRAGYAPRIVVTRGASEAHAIEAAQRLGLDVPDDADAAVMLLRAAGVAPGAIIVPERLHDNTADEAHTLQQLAAAGGWRRVIVVSSIYHLRRAGLACRRALRQSGVRVIMRGTRYDTSTPDRWWQRRADIRWLASELPKLAAYALGADA
jgi:uncharacterized SAM-binding protein YcdF (DUF218 family)